MNKKFIVGVFIALIIGIPLVAFGTGWLRLPTEISSVPIGDGAWNLISRYDGMTVSGESTTDTFLDPDGPITFPTVTDHGLAPIPTGGLVPGVSVAFSGFRQAEDMATVRGFFAYTYDFDIDVSTTADKDGLWYESDLAVVRVNFAAVLQEGIFEEKPDAMISDMTILSGSAAVTQYAATSWADAKAQFEDEAKQSGYPHLAISPEVRFVDPPSSGSQITTGGTTDEVQASIKRLELRSGAIYTAIAFGTLIAHPRDVLAHFTIRVVVLSETPEDQPAVNPFAWFLQFLQDLGFIPPTMGEDILTILAIIGIAIFILLFTCIIACAWSRKR